LRLSFDRPQLRRITRRPFAPGEDCQGCCHGREHSNRAFPLQHHSMVRPCGANVCNGWEANIPAM
jgi:hypothetical protein